MQDRTRLSSPFPRGPRPLPRRKPKSASPTSADIRRCATGEQEVRPLPLGAASFAPFTMVQRRLDRFTFGSIKNETRTCREGFRGRWTAGPAIGERWSSRLVATAAEIEPNYLTHVRLAAAGK